VEYISLG